MPQLNVSNRPRLRAFGGRVAKSAAPQGTLHLPPDQVPVTAILRSLRNEAGRSGGQKSAAVGTVASNTIVFDERQEQPRDPDYAPPALAAATMAAAAPARPATVTLEELLKPKADGGAAIRAATSATAVAPALSRPAPTAAMPVAPQTTSGPPPIVASSMQTTRGVFNLSLAQRAIALAALVVAGMFIPTLVLDGFQLSDTTTEPKAAVVAPEAPEAPGVTTIGTPGGAVTIPGPAFMDGRLASDPPKTLSVIWLWDEPFSAGDIRCTLPHSTAVQLEELAESASGRRSVRVEHESCSGWANADLISATAHPPEGLVENNSR